MHLQYLQKMSYCWVRANDGIDIRGHEKVEAMMELFQTHVWLTIASSPNIE
jgi:hypothetical protein